MTDEWRWRIKQDGQVVASGICTDRRMMLSEMGRYAMQYAEDGPIEALETRTGKNKWRRHNP